MDNTPDSHEIIVIGAGMAGLTAALHLAERGLAVTVLEADPLYPGGRLSGKAAVELNGWSFPGEHGVHGIWSGYVNLQAMLVRHHIRPALVPAWEEDWFYRRGSRLRKAAIGSAIRRSPFPAPFHYLSLFLHPGFLATIEGRDLLSLVSIWSGLLYPLGIDPLGENQPMEGLTMHDMTGHWSPALRALFVGLARNGFAGQPEEIPLSGFVAFLRFYTVLRRDAWAFSYLPGDGGSKVIDPLVGRITELGGRLRLGARVNRLEQRPDGPGWRVLLESSEALEARRVILATDAPAAQAILSAGPQTGALAANLFFPRGGATAVVRVWFDRRPRQTAEAGIFSGDFVFDNFFWLDRLYEPYLRWSKETGGSALEVHLYGPPAALAEPDALLLARALSDVQAAFPELRGHRLHQVLQRNPPAHTLFGLGPVERHLGIRTPWADLFCCGDWVRDEAPALFLERACITGIEAANAVLQAEGQSPWPSLPYPPPEPLAAWIERWMLKGRKARRRKQKK